MGLITEHQSPGYYKYNCDKKEECYFCEVMNRKPISDDDAFSKNGWSVNQIKYILENYHKQPINVTCNYLQRSRRSLFSKIYMLRKQNHIILTPKRTPLTFGQVKVPVDKNNLQADY